MSTSAKLRLLLESEARRTLNPAERAWFVPHVRGADWRSLRRDFPLLWQRVHDTPAGVEAVAELPDTRSLFAEDVLLLADREGQTVRREITGSGRSGAIRSATILAMAKEHGPSAARFAAAGMRAWRWQQFQKQFADGWAAAGSTSSGLALHGDMLTRTPGFEEFANGQLAMMAASGTGNGAGLSGSTDGDGSAIVESVEVLAEASKEATADLLEMAEDSADVVVEAFRFLGRWTLRGAALLFGVPVDV